MSKESKSLKAGINYPKNLDQFMSWFHDEQSCLSYLKKLRWPNGFICPNCFSENVPYILPKNKFKCVKCRKQTSVTAGTIFDKTRPPLKSWFAVIWSLVQAQYRPPLNLHTYTSLVSICR